MTGQIDEVKLQAHTEIDDTDSALQLAMFRRSHVINKVLEAAIILRNMSIDTRSMFSEV